MEDQTQIDILIGIGVLAMICVSMLIIIVFTTYRSKLLQRESKIQLEIFRSRTEAEENQKEAIANNLHDEILPLLTALSQNIKQHKKRLGEGTLMPEEFDRDFNIIDQSARGIRAIALDLIPTTFLNYGLFKAIEQHIEQLNNGDKVVELEINTTYDGELPFTKNEQINIYRICLEIINNLQKHADFTCLHVTIENTETLFIFRFIHDGNSIGNEEIELLSQSSKGRGLKSLKSRSVFLNASINYSKEEKLPRVQLVVPFKISSTL